MDGSRNVSFLRTSCVNLPLTHPDNVPHTGLIVVVECQQGQHMHQVVRVEAEVCVTWQPFLRHFLRAYHSSYDTHHILDRRRTDRGQRKCTLSPDMLQFGSAYCRARIEEKLCMSIAGFWNN